MKKAVSENYTKINHILTKAFVNNKSVNFVLKQKNEKIYFKFDGLFYIYR